MKVATRSVVEICVQHISNGACPGHRRTVQLKIDHVITTCQGNAWCFLADCMISIYIIRQASIEWYVNGTRMVLTGHLLPVEASKLGPVHGFGSDSRLFEAAVPMLLYNHDSQDMWDLENWKNTPVAPTAHKLG